MSCTICHSSKVINNGTIKDVYSHEVFDLLKCQDCDYVWIKNMPGPDQIGKYYENELGDIMKTKRDDLSSSMQDVIFSLDLKKLLELCSKDDLIVDWGAGHGRISYYLHRNGHKVEAIDFSDDSHWIINEVPYNQLNSNNFEDGSIDRFLQEKKPKAVILRHTLEHFLYPDKLIETFAKNNVKYVLIIVPNNQSFLKSVFGKFWYYWDPPRHVSFFSSKNLNLLHSQSGYNLVKRKTYGIDEIYNSFARFISLVFGEKSFLSKLFPFNNIISSLVSAASYPFTNAVLWSLYQLKKNESQK